MKGELKNSDLKGILNVGALPRFQEKEVAPQTQMIEVVADSGYSGLSKVIVEAVTSSIDSNIIAENIKENVEILGVVGTHKSGYQLEVDNDKLVFESENVEVNESELILND